MKVIKTRVNHPFIYFFVEPNVVFVYKIETKKYLTVSELIQSGAWETFKIKNAEEFDTFNHEEDTPLEGQGYSVSQDSINIMVEKINQQIQRQRNSFNFSKEDEKNGIISTSVHLVSSESAAGTLRVGLARPKTVIGFPDFLGIGPVWKLHDKIGQTFRHEWLYENINSEQDDYEYENKFTNTLLEIEDIPDHVPIHIWYANNGNEQTSVRFFLYLLRNKANKVYIINTTELYDKYITSKDEKQSMFYTSLLGPEIIKFLFEQNREKKPLSYEERIQFQNEWESLAQSKELLRLWQNKRVDGVTEQYFDSQILKIIEKLHNEQENKDFIKAGIVIGETLNQIEELVSDSFIEFRIRYLIYSGMLELKGVPKSMRHYSVKIR